MKQVPNTGTQEGTGILNSQLPHEQSTHLQAILQTSVVLSAPTLAVTHTHPFNGYTLPAIKEK